LPVVLELPRDHGDALVEYVVGAPLRLREHDRRLFGVALALVGETLPAGVDLETALHDHRPGDEHTVRMRYRAVALIAGHMEKFGAERLAP
jgi:hypothetical protein